jgi:hypothetical protein
MAARVAFYAPEAAPTLMARFAPGGDMAGSGGVRRRELGQRLALRIARRIAALPPAERPTLLLSLRVRGGAPDLIGPHPARALGLDTLHGIPA